MKRRVILALVLATAALAAGCPPKPAQEAVPPAGLAGGGPGSSATLSLPGQGAPAVEPSGGTGSPLPAGHPPIGNAGAAAGATAANGAAPGPSTLPPSLTGAPTMPPPPQETLITGKVLETMDVSDYTYMRLQTSSGDEWVAISRSPMSVGSQVSVASNVVMENFPSRSLNRTFPRLTMGTLVGAPKKP